MYKVFIDNKPIIFQINSQLIHSMDVEKGWKAVTKFLKTDKKRLKLEIKDEADFKNFFSSYKYIEAAGGLVQRDNSFLFIKRNGFWDIPKGKLDKGETPKIAAVREIEEECGLIAPVIKQHLIDTWHTYTHKKKNVLKRTYWYWLDEGDQKVELIPQAEEGITDVAYFLEDEFDTILSNTFLSIAAVIKSLKKAKKK